MAIHLTILLLPAMCLQSSSAGPDDIGREQISRIPIVKQSDIRFRKLLNAQNLSQVRVHSIVQDFQGFLWFGTWNGLNRYDGYKYKIFKHDAGDNSSLSGTHIYALFLDRKGNLWVGTDQFLDRFDPLTETFRHYHLNRAGEGAEATLVNHISEDPSGMLWLSTNQGLIRLDAESGQMIAFRHSPQDRQSLADDDVKTTYEDRSGIFWVGSSKSLDEFDRKTGKVKRHIDVGESGIGLFLHEDRAGVFWIIYGSDGHIGTLDRASGVLKRIEYEWVKTSPQVNQAYAMLEDHEGTMWFGTAGAGLMRYDRANHRFLSYTHDKTDYDSIGENRVITLFEDRETNIWIGLHQAEPNYFRKKPLPFQNLNLKSGCSEGDLTGLVSTIHEDSRGNLWLAANRRLYRIHRKTGKCAAFKETDNSEVLSIAEDRKRILWLGNASPGLRRYDLKTGEQKGYKHDSRNPVTLCSGVIDQVFVDSSDRLWAATWDGLCLLDSARQLFTRYRPKGNARGLNYYSIAEAPDGALWLGSNMGVHRFDRDTLGFQVWNHQRGDATSLSDSRVNAVFFDRAGRLWLGTQNGFDHFDLKTGKVTRYGHQNGLAGNAVSCVLEDSKGTLWLSTNKGISSFKPETKRFANYTVADGLPGPDMTGWGSCHQNAAGEMFFAGFSGATAFFPKEVEEDQLPLPRTVLTDFRLFGKTVLVGAVSPLKAAINHTHTINLSHEQNVFSIEFSALSYLNPGSARYRYKLDGVDEIWREVGSDERLAAYTTLPGGDYLFQVQSATSRGDWSPAVSLKIEVSPPFWKTSWFMALLALLATAAIWIGYKARLRMLREEFQARLEERIGERTRIARELHDTLLQNMTGLSLQISGLAKRHSEPAALKASLMELRQQAEACLLEARQSVWDIRSAEAGVFDLGREISSSGKQLTAGKGLQFHFEVEGQPYELPANLGHELFRIAREAITNSARHAKARRIDARLIFGAEHLIMRIADDGCGFDLKTANRNTGHFGLAAMCERADNIPAQIRIVSTQGEGTMIEVMVAVKSRSSK